MNCPLFFLVLNPKSDFSDSILPRGFTGHEHFSEIALIHMNGRMYDPQLKRFLSPDNNIIDPFDTRSFDRFGYAFHNPLMNIDINGENSFEAIGDWFKRNSKIITIIAQVVVAVGLTILTAGVASPIIAGAYVGLGTGFTGGFVRTLTQGGNIGQALLAGGLEGLAGAVSGAIGGGIFQGLQKGVALGKNATKLAGTKVGGFLRNFTATGQSGLERTVTGVATRGLFAAGTQFGLQTLNQERFDEYYASLQQENPVSIEGVFTGSSNPTMVAASSNAGGDHSGYGTLSEAGPSPYEGQQTESYAETLASAVESIGSGAAGLNAGSFTTGSISGGVEVPEENEEENEEDEEENEEDKIWYLDNDNDGYHSEIRMSEIMPVEGNWKSTTKGEDCDDMNALVWKLNICNKCELEPESTDWLIDDFIENGMGLLKDMLNRAYEKRPDLKIVKRGDHAGANTDIICGEIRIGEQVNYLEALSKLAFELSHIIHEDPDKAINAVFALTRDDFLRERAEFEAQGKVFSKITEEEQRKTLNDCEKNILGNFNPLENDYSGKTIDEIIDLIQENGELENETQKVLNGTIPSNNNIPFVDHFGPFYDEWQENIEYYRNEENETNETIRDRFIKVSDCN